MFTLFTVPLDTPTVTYPAPLEFVVCGALQFAGIVTSSVPYEGKLSHAVPPFAYVIVIVLLLLPATTVAGLIIALPNPSAGVFVGVIVGVHVAVHVGVFVAVHVPVSVGVAVFVCVGACITTKLLVADELCTVAPEFASVPKALLVNVTVSDNDAENTQVKYALAPPGIFALAGALVIAASDGVLAAGVIGSTLFAAACPLFVTLMATVINCPKSTVPGKACRSALKAAGDCTVTFRGEPDIGAVLSPDAVLSTAKEAVPGLLCACAAPAIDAVVSPYATVICPLVGSDTTCIIILFPLTKSVNKVPPTTPTATYPAAELLLVCGVVHVEGIVTFKVPYEGELSHAVLALVKLMTMVLFVLPAETVNGLIVAEPIPCTGVLVGVGVIVFVNVGVVVDVGDGAITSILGIGVPIIVGFEPVGSV